MKRDIVIFGSGGFAKEVLWLIAENNKIRPEWNVLGFIDSNFPESQKDIHGYQIIGNDQWLLDYEGEINVVIGIGNSETRAKIVQKLEHRNNIKFPSLISHGAILSDSVTIGKGCILCTNSIISVDISLGDFVTINLDCTVGHDDILEDFVTLYPSVNVSGSVRIGSQTEIGTGSQIIQGLTIGQNSIVGAGSVVIRDIPDHSVAVGNPAKVIKQR